VALKVPCKARMPLRTCHVVKEGPFREDSLTAMGDGLREHVILEGRVVRSNYEVKRFIRRIRL
jgi:hypothetical protein